MRPAKILSFLAGVAMLVGMLGIWACAKSPPPANSAPLEVAASADKAADSTPPPGVDVSHLDDFQKKVFFRIANTEASLCGQAQSLLQSAKAEKGGCRR